MSKNQDSGTFSVEKTSRAYKGLTALACLLILAAAGLQVAADLKQAESTRVVEKAWRAYALVQRAEMAAARFDSTREYHYLDIVKEAAGAALGLHDDIARPLSSVAEIGPSGNRMPLPGLQALRAYIDDAMTYAVSPLSDDAAESAHTRARLAVTVIPETWEEEIDAFTAARGRETDMLSLGALGAGGLAFLLVLYGAAGLVSPAMRQVEKQRDYLERMAAADVLTGTYNRATLFRVVTGLLSSARRYKQDITVLAVDIDGLQKINDEHGRAAGDGAVRAVAKAMNTQLRTSDVIGRVGGGEFAIFLPATDEYRATYAAEKIRAAVTQANFSVKDTVVFLRVSIGIAQLRAQHKSADDLLRSAETALRHAKDTGRNRAATWSGMQEEKSQTPPPPLPDSPATPRIGAAHAAQAPEEEAS